MDRFDKFDTLCMFEYEENGDSGGIGGGAVSAGITVSVDSALRSMISRSARFLDFPLDFPLDKEALSVDPPAVPLDPLDFFFFDFDFEDFEDFEGFAVLDFLDLDLCLDLDL